MLVEYWCLLCACSDRWDTGLPAWILYVCASPGFCAFCFKGRFWGICWLGFLCVMKCRDQGRQQQWQPLYYLTPTFLSSHFLFHPNVIYPPLAFLFSLPSLPERRRMQSQVNTLICGRNLSHPPPPSLSLSLSPHSLCRSSWLTPLCFKSRIPAQLLYLEPSHVQRCVREVCLTIWVCRQGSYSRPFYVWNWFSV